MFDPKALKLLTLQELAAICDQLILGEQTDWDAFDQVEAEMKSRVARFNRMVEDVHYGLSRPQDLKTVPGIAQAKGKPKN